MEENKPLPEYGEGMRDNLTERVRTLRLAVDALEAKNWNCYDRERVLLIEITKNIEGLLQSVVTLTEQSVKARGSK